MISWSEEWAPLFPLFPRSDHATSLFYDVINYPIPAAVAAAAEHDDDTAKN